MLFLKQSTASQSVLIGPFVDSTDGDTAETGLSIANTDIKLSKNGGTMASKNSGGATHDAGGWYTITLDATDTNTVGRLQLSCKVSGALAVFAEYQVLEEAIYDALIGASASAFDSSAYVKGVSGTLNTLDSLDSAQDSQHSTTQSAISGLSIPSAGAIADAVLDEALSGHTTAGTLGKAVTDIETDVDAVLVDTGTTLPATLSGLNDVSVSDIWTTQLTESYAADGSAPTGTQALMLIQQALTEFAYSGTSFTVKKLDGSTTAAVMTLDDGTSPTSATRSS